MNRFLIPLALVAWLAGAAPARAEPPPTFLLQWGSTGTGNGQFNHPLGIAVAPSGNVFVVERTRVQKFTGTGQFLLSWNEDDITGIAVDGNGVVYVHTAGLIRKYDEHSTSLGEFDAPSYGPIAVDPPGYYLYIAGYTVVARYKTDGTFVDYWQTGSDRDRESNMGIAFVSPGYVYVSRTAVDEILELRLDGVVQSTLGGRGTGEGQFKSPLGLAVDAQGYLYACDGNNRIQKFRSDGALMSYWGTWGSGEGEFNVPYDVAVDADRNIYVVDYYNDRVQKFGYVTVPVIPTTWGRLKVMYGDQAGKGER